MINTLRKDVIRMDNTLFIYAPKAIIAPKWVIDEALQSVTKDYLSESSDK